MGRDNTEQFKKQVEFFGSGTFEIWCDKNGVVIDSGVRELLKINEGRNPVWEELVDSGNIGLFDRNGFDLLTQMFRMNPVILLG